METFEEETGVEIEERTKVVEGDVNMNEKKDSL